MSAIRLGTLCECGMPFEDHTADTQGVMTCTCVGCSHFKAVEREKIIYQDPRPCKTCGYPRSHHGNVGGLEVPFYHVYAPKGDEPSDAGLKILDTLTDAQLDAYLKGREIRQKSGEHSPFPWSFSPKIGYALVVDKDDVLVANAFGGGDLERCEKNARILSCAGDGVELARLVLVDWRRIHKMAEDLLKKAGL